MHVIASYVEAFSMWNLFFHWQGAVLDSDTICNTPTPLGIRDDDDFLLIGEEIPHRKGLLVWHTYMEAHIFNGHDAF